MLRSCSVNHRRIIIVVSGVGFRRTLAFEEGLKFLAAAPLSQIRSSLLESDVYENL